MRRTYFSIEELKGQLSETELKILDVLRKNGESNSAYIYSSLRNNGKLARSSVPVLLERLYDKGLLMRKRQTCRGGKRYIYSLKTTKDKYYKSVVESIVNRMIEKFGNVAVSYFHKRFSKR